MSWGELERRFLRQRITGVAPSWWGARFRLDTADLLQSRLYWFGVWEPNHTRWVVESLRPGDGFIDIGANIGYYTLLASHLTGHQGSVAAIEASPSIFRQLQENVARNRARNVTAIHAAAASRRGTVEVRLGPSYNLGKTSTVGGEGLVEARVRAAPIPALVAPELLAAARIIKIDVEGAEGDVVAGFAAVMRHLRRDVEFLIEITPARRPGRRDVARHIVDFFSDHGFSASALRNDYSLDGYLSGMPPLGPRRLRLPLVQQTDVVFSRRARRR
ncbi:MAG: FkbM family methyltransferase [Myxococcaceae bacterium]|nr:FkbM family methyltransferase [Myxococcaceae bacterium]